MKKGSVRYTSKLSPESFHLGVERFGKSVRRSGNEVVQDIVLSRLDGISGRLDFAYGAAVYGLVPAVQLIPGCVLGQRLAAEDGSQFAYHVVRLFDLGILRVGQVTTSKTTVFEPKSPFVWLPF